MAHSLSAKKRNRQNIKRRMVNRARRSTVRTKVRKCFDLFLHGTVEQAESAVKDTARTLDREATRGTLHRNAAARRKSRLARNLRAMRQKATSQ